MAVVVLREFASGGPRDQIGFHCLHAFHLLKKFLQIPFLNLQLTCTIKWVFKKCRNDLRHIRDAIFRWNAFYNTHSS